MAVAVAKAPPMTLEQRMAGLKRANRIRVARAETKRQIKLGGLDPTRLLENVPLDHATWKVEALLRAVPGLGDVKVARLMQQCRVSDSKTLGGLSVRQREALVDALVEWRARG